MRTNRARHRHARCDRSNRLSASLGPQGWHIGRMMDGQTLRRQHTRTKHEPPARWSSRMSLYGHRDRAIDLMAGGRKATGLRKSAATVIVKRSGSPSHRLLSHRAKVVDEPGAIARMGGAAAAGPSSAPWHQAHRPRERVLWQWCQRFGGEVPQVLEVRVLAANGNNDISFDYMRLSTEYSKIMLVYQ